MSTHRTRPFFVLSSTLLFAPTVLGAPPEADPDETNVVVGPASVDLGTDATLKVPKGWRWNGSTLTSVEDSEQGLAIAFSAIGHVQIKGVKSPDPKALLSAIEKKSSDKLKWALPPKLDTKAKNFTFATEGANGGLVFEGFVLGRSGLVIVAGPMLKEEFAKDLSIYRRLMAGVSFRPGRDHDSFQPGDKVATLGFGEMALAFMHKDPPSVDADAGEAFEEGADGGVVFKSGPYAGITFQVGPGTGDLETHATIRVPEGFFFIAGREQTQKLLNASRHFPSGNEVGALFSSKAEWIIYFDFHPIGYVRNDEKGSIDADALLASIKDARTKANEVRRAKGWPEVDVVGWEARPNYSEKTDNLEWAVRIKAESGEGIEHHTRLLGRRGVMSASLLSTPDNFSAALRKAREVLTGFAFSPGNDYGSFKEGDAVATVGLAGLIAGSAWAIVAASNALKKVWKWTASAVAIVGAVIVFFVARASKRRKARR